MSSSDSEWRKIRVLFWIASTGLLALFLVIGIVALEGRPPNFTEFLEVGAAFLLQLFIGIFLGRAKCPSCGGAFFVSPMNAYVVHPLTPRCQACGIDKYAEIPTRLI